MKTYQPKAKEIKRQWHLINAKGQVLGRMAGKIASLLMGKHKANYATYLDMGDCVVVINAKDIKITGKKKKQKVYQKHSGYPGGFKQVKYEKWLKEAPEKIIEHAVAGMLPKNRLQKPRLRRMRVYAGDKHKYGDKIKKKMSN